MTTNDAFGRVLTAWLDEDAPHHVADHLDEVLQLTAATRQRPAWSSPERWLPMDLTTRIPSVRSPSAALRPIALLIVLALLVAALVAVAIGTRQRSLEPFGLARNGTWVSSADGDLYTIDPVTGANAPLVVDAGFDFSPIFSRDGTRIAFLRSDGPIGNPAILTLMVANADGSAVHAVTEPIQALDWWDWSPDGTRIAFMASALLFVVDTATGDTIRLDAGGRVHFPTWLPPDGRQIVFRHGTGRPGIWAVNPDGTGLTELSKTTPNNEYDFQSPALSPDGTTITFTRWSTGGIPRVYALDVATGSERVFPTASGTSQRGWAPFSPDGSLIAYQQLLRDGASQLVVAASDGSGEARPVGPGMPANNEGNPIDVSVLFTPDGTALIVRYGTDDGGTTHRLPLDGSAGSIISEGTFEFVDVQRVAP